MIIRPSGRSTDFLSPTLIMNCGFDCSYCYCKRYKTEGIDVAKNIDQILTEIDHHAWFAGVEKPNQTHPEYITYDIGSYSDLGLHLKHYDWRKVFDFFRDHPIAMGSFATKYVNEELLNYNPKEKIRIRFSLMPQSYSDILEPKTSLIENRVLAADKFIKAGYDVHFNFSPVIITDTWLKDYKDLFNLVNKIIVNKDKIKSEVIFLTHNIRKHEHNLLNNLPGEDLIWKPELQESKISQYGGENIRYKGGLKSQYIEQFKQLHKEIIDWCTIRYIF
jgi:spore photoproduct lyase